MESVFVTEKSKPFFQKMEIVFLEKKIKTVSSTKKWKAFLWLKKSKSFFSW